MRVAPPTTKYLQFLSAYEPRITALAVATRALVLREAPDAVELLYDAYNAVAAGYSFTGRPSDAFIHIAAYAQWVNLGFNHGAALEDPGELLQGKGSRVRHIRISALVDLKNPALRDFIRTAASRAKHPEAPAPAKHHSVVRAIYARRRRPKSR
jgi:hypothetical protein